MTWHLLTEIKPKNGQKCLICENGLISLGWWVVQRGGFIDGEGGSFPKATHWMVLPPLPEKESEELI